MILCGNPQAQYLAHKEEIDRAIARVLDNGWYILGEEVKAFEAEFAAFCGVTHAIGVGSGTDALHLALRACGIGPDDEVITVAHSAVATVAAIELCGASPVLVDIEHDYYTMAPASFEAAIGPKTKAVVPVHLYGQSADLSAIMEIASRHGLRVIEDCAQAHGAVYGGRRVGSWGDLACYSFYPTKNLGALGDGGMVVTSSSQLADRVRRLREYGWNGERVAELPGLNSRLDELQAAILRIKLRHLEADNLARAVRARWYDQAFADVPCIRPRCRPDATHVYHLYVIRSQRREALRTHLRERGIAALVHYAVPAHAQAAYAKRFPGGECLPETERAAREVLSLPMYPELRRDELDQVVEAVKSFPWSRS